MKDVLLSIISASLRIAALPAAMAAARPSLVPVSSLAISSALIQTPSSLSLAYAVDLPDPFGPPRMMHVGCDNYRPMAA